MVSELRKSLRENSDVLDEMEEQIEEETPSLFLDYAAADEEDRAMLDVSYVGFPPFAVRYSDPHVYRPTSRLLGRITDCKHAMNGTCSEMEYRPPLLRCCMVTLKV